MAKPSSAWPMVNYMPAWKTFRRESDEPEITAEHVIHQPGWPRKEPLSILDIGCGDGRMIEAFLFTVHQDIDKVVLLDPDEHMLHEARAEIESYNLGTVVEPRLGVADLGGTELAKCVDVGLAIHVAYLLPPTSFQNLVRRWPCGKPLYVVLDSPGSVFTQLWERTAPEYAARSTSIHAFFAENASVDSSIAMTTFSTRVASPFLLADKISRLVLSLLSYRQYDELTPDLRQHVDDTVQAHIEGDKLVCKCSCYEILKKEP
jgi:SAM-dependent methyltransferase